MQQAAYSERHKHSLDLALATLLLLMLSPVLLAISFMIWLAEGSPVLFRQERIGASGSTFVVLKFRTMPTDTANLPSAQGSCLAVTRMGRVLRRANLDELPQLINIVKGEMSLVGPRPPLPSETELIDMRRESGALALRPGLTGLAQVNSYDGMPTAEKAALDARYAARLSLSFDMRIVLNTFGYLLRPPPNY